MKKSLVTLSVLAAASSALASQVRFDSLQGARTTRQDFVEMFAQPSVMWSGEVKDQVLFEKAITVQRGGFLMSSDDAKYGLVFGYQTAVAANFNTVGAGAGTVDNPINFLYGRDLGGLKWGFNLYYASSKDEVTSPKLEKSYSGLAAGVNGDGWRADVALGLGGNVKNLTNNDEGKAKQSVRAQFEYDLNSDLRTYIDVSSVEFDTTITGVTTTTKQSKYDVGIERKVAPKEGYNFFYGAKLSSSTTDVGGAKTETQQLPVYVGAEAEAASWLVLRAAIRQPVLIDTVKSGGNAKTNVSNATYSAGAGVRLGEFLIDGDIATSLSGVGSGGTLNSNSLMANLALTYHF